MWNGYDFKTVFSFFLKTGWRARRTKMFFLFSLIPALVLLIIRIVQWLNPEASIFSTGMFYRIGVEFYFQLFIQILCLFYGASVLSDESDHKTLVYLTTSPVPKATILLAKYAAVYIISMFIISAGLVLSFLISYIDHLSNPTYIQGLLSFMGIALLAALAYSSLFTILGSLVKKSILFGIIFIFGWESIVQYFPGTTQKLTINHYIKSLLPFHLSGGGGFLAFRLQPSSTAGAIVTLLLLTVLFLSVTTFIFYKKEYVLSDQA
jgi:ABC-type transport system involved in multi-copper enzyme maturation permease subunit